MVNIKKFFLNDRIYSFFLITIFVICLTPYSTSLGKSANYSFVFFILLIILINGKFNKPNNYIIINLLFFFIIFFLSTIYHYDFLYLLDKRLISFLIFMTIFSFVFVDLDKKEIDAFKIAIVTVIFFLAVLKLGKFFYYSADGQSNLKSYVGSSRYGFVYVFAFWIVDRQHC